MPRPPPPPQRATIITVGNGKFWPLLLNFIVHHVKIGLLAAGDVRLELHALDNATHALCEAFRSGDTRSETGGGAATRHAVACVHAESLARAHRDHPSIHDQKERAKELVLSYKLRAAHAALLRPAAPPVIVLDADAL